MRSIRLGNLLGALAWFHPFADEKEIREDEDKPPWVVNFLARRSRSEEDLDIDGAPDLALEGKRWRGNLKADLLCVWMEGAGGQL